MVGTVLRHRGTASSTRDPALPDGAFQSDTGREQQEQAGDEPKAQRLPRPRFSWLFLEAALFVVRAGTAPDNATVAQSPATRLLLPFRGQQPVTRHFLQGLDTGHAQTASPWRKERCPSQKGEVRNRRFPVADSSQARSSTTSPRARSQALVTAPTHDRPPADTGLSSAHCGSCVVSPHFTARSGTQPCGQHSSQ